MSDTRWGKALQDIQGMPQQDLTPAEVKSAVSQFVPMGQVAKSPALITQVFPKVSPSAGKLIPYTGQSMKQQIMGMLPQTRMDRFEKALGVAGAMNSHRDVAQTSALPTGPQYDIQGDPDMDVNGAPFELMRNHFLTAANLPYEPNVKPQSGVGSAPAQVYNPSYEGNVNANYDRSVNAIDSRMKPAIDKTQALLDAFSNYDPSRTSGSSIGSQMALQAIGALTPQVANLHAEGAKQVGALPLMSQGLEAYKYGNKGPEEAQMQDIRDKSALGQAQVNTQKAHARLFGAQADKAVLDASPENYTSKEDLANIKREEHLITSIINAKRNNNEAIDPGAIQEEVRNALNGFKKETIKGREAQNNILRPNVTAIPDSFRYVPQEVAGAQPTAGPHPAIASKLLAQYGGDPAKARAAYQRGER